MHVSILLLTWDGKRYLPDLFESIDDQTYKNRSLYIYDNGSVDGTVEYLRQYKSQEFVGRNVKNEGYSKGYNDLFKFFLDHATIEQKEGLVVFINQDIILSEDCIEKMVQEFEGNPEIGSIQPKLYRAFGEPNTDEELAEVTKSDIIDSVGLELRKDWRFYEMGAGEMDKGQYEKGEFIVGATGALGMYRVAALQDAMVDGNVFDPLYFSYKEDCDLALRIIKTGWKCYYAPNVKAHHYRGMYGANKMNLLQRLMKRRSRRPFFAALSTRNEIFNHIKHIAWGDVLRYFPWLIFHLAGRVLYGFVFEPQTRKEILKLPKHLPYLFDIRRKIREKQVIAPEELRSYVS